MYNQRCQRKWDGREPIQVGSILGNLKDLALDMGNEIEAQNQQIDWLTEKADTNQDHTDVANAWAKKLIDR